MKDINKPISVEASSGNVYADLGCEDAEDRLAKADITINIHRIVQELGLNQTEAAGILGIDQPSISKLFKGQLRGFTTDRLLKFLTLLDQDIVITIKPASSEDVKQHRSGKISVVS